MRKRIALPTATAIAVFVAGGFVLYVNYPDRNLPTKAEFYRAKGDIAGIENAVRLFHERNGRYPRNLEELTRKQGDTTDDNPWLVSMPASPWGGAYQYRVQSGPSGESYKIWTVPDAQTQQIVKVAEVSNTTDWRAMGMAR